MLQRLLELLGFMTQIRLAGASVPQQTQGLIMWGLASVNSMESDLTDVLASSACGNPHRRVDGRVCMCVCLTT